MDTFIKGPSKRDVAGMKQAFGEVQTGEVISVLYKTVRYGNFLVTGTAHKTVLDELMVGGLNAAAAGKKAKGADGEEITSCQPDKDVRAFPAEFSGEFTPQEIEVSSVKHGDLVVVSFRQLPYGDFVLTGVATEDEKDAQRVQVGPWIIRTVDGPASRMLDVKLVATAGSHIAPVPTRRGAVEADDLA